MPEDDDWSDFPSSLHPGREALTGCLAFALTAMFIGWLLWVLAWRALDVWG